MNTVLNIKCNDVVDVVRHKRMHALIHASSTTSVARTFVSAIRSSQKVSCMVLLAQRRTTFFASPFSSSSTAIGYAAVIPTPNATTPT